MTDTVIDLGLTSSDYAVGPGPAGCYSPDATNPEGELFLTADTAQWVFEAASRLDSLARLQANWDSHRGLPLQPVAKRLTIDVLHWLRKAPLPVPAVVLGSGGTVHLEWRRKGKELDVGLGEGHGIEFLKVHPQGTVEEGVATANLPSHVRDLTLWFLG